ncbi:MAG: DNA-directed RNA polymerase subunit L [Canidatus Methanoxibalbensis ujae]|nr:DNA-directed RNA polymerase subunit L [Candidatus Methanoxibalbensis ujae]MCW7078404.1 DNA-directed RNA polymerase subunit L [Candidatus Methanoxibalbensis ujae]
MRGRMHLKVLERGKGMIKLEIKGETHTFLVPLVAKLLEDERVEMATYNMKHPILSDPVLFVKLRDDETDVIDVLISAASALKSDFEEFESRYRAAMV